MIEFVAFFGTILAGTMLAAAALSWIRRGGWALFLAAAMGVAGFAWVSLTAGYGGWLGELLIALFATVALTLPIGLLVANLPNTKRPHPSDKPRLSFLFLPLVVGVLVPWTGRVNWAKKMAWSCDGVIIEKYRSSNHQAPTLVVRNHNGTKTELEGVSATIWARAAADDRLRKEPGRSDAQLNGQRIELVLRHGW